MSATLIENATIVTLNGSDEIFAPGYLLIHGDLLSGVASGAAPPSLRAKAAQVIDATGKIAMPGLINSHDHLFQSFVRGLADDRPLLQWLEEIVWPVFSHMTQEDIYLAAMVGLIGNIRGGATALIDNHYVHIDPRSDDAVCQAAAEIGIRYQLARGWADNNYHRALMESPERIFGETARLVDTWHGQADGRIRIGFGPLIPWGCSDESMLRMHSFAQDHGLTIQMHTAETQAEVALSIKRRGQRHVEWLEGLGVLGPHFSLVHAAWLDDREIDLVARAGANVVHCPVSNMFLASGVAPVEKLRRRGVPVALATDGQACNNGQEMIDLLKWTANLHKVSSLDAMALHPADILGMACSGGAAAFGEPKRLGSLEAGNRADLILVDATSPRLGAGTNAVSNLVNFASSQDVDTVIVNGRIIMDHGRLCDVDEAALLERAWRARKDLLTRAGLQP